LRLRRKRASEKTTGRSGSVPIRRASEGRELVQPQDDDPLTRVVTDGHPVQGVGRLDVQLCGWMTMNWVAQAPECLGEESEVGLVERRVHLMARRRERDGIPAGEKKGNTASKRK